MQPSPEHADGLSDSIYPTRTPTGFPRCTERYGYYFSLAHAPRSSITASLERAASAPEASYLAQSLARPPRRPALIASPWQPPGLISRSIPFPISFRQLSRQVASSPPCNPYNLAPWQLPSDPYCLARSSPVRLHPPRPRLSSRPTRAATEIRTRPGRRDRPPDA